MKKISAGLMRGQNGEPDYWLYAYYDAPEVELLSAHNVPVRWPAFPTVSEMARLETLGAGSYMGLWLHKLSKADLAIMLSSPAVKTCWNTQRHAAEPVTSGRFGKLIHVERVPVPSTAELLSRGYAQHQTKEQVLASLEPDAVWLGAYLDEGADLASSTRISLQHVFWVPESTPPPTQFSQLKHWAYFHRAELMVDWHTAMLVGSTDLLSAMRTNKVTTHHNVTTGDCYEKNLRTGSQTLKHKIVPAPLLCRVRRVTYDLTGQTPPIIATYDLK